MFRQWQWFTDGWEDLLQFRLDNAGHILVGNSTNNFPLPKDGAPVTSASDKATTTTSIVTTGEESPCP